MVFVGALLAATTGVVAASVISMGLISLPIMLRYGYDRRLASGVIAASGTLAQIIPPSLVLIVMADQLGRSVGDMYEGAFIPGIVLSLLYAGYVFLMTIFYPKSAPALPLEARTLSDPDRSGAISFLVLLAVTVAFTIGAAIWLRTRMETGAEISAVFLGVAFAFLVALANRLFRLGLLSRLAEQVVFVLVPPLALIFLVLGTIFIGVATPTEGGAMGAAGALILAFFKRRLSLDLMNQAMQSTAKLSAFVIFILVGARVFSLTFYGVNGHKWVEELLVGLPGGEIGFLIVVNILVFLLAFFLDFFELAFIIIPLLGPAAERLGIDLIWFGVVMGVNMQTSFMHPPFGFALFYLRSVAPREPYHRQDHQAAHGADHHRPDLLGCGAVRRDPGDHGRAGDRLPRHGDALQGGRYRRRPGLDPAARHPADGRPAAARLRRPARPRGQRRTSGPGGPGQPARGPWPAAGPGRPSARAGAPASAAAGAVAPARWCNAAMLRLWLA